eukprot:COSAG04_NODE_127_length_24502_cov_31.657583_8_plen_466_part_00
MQTASLALLETAGRVAHQLEQLHATLAAQSGDHNDGACLMLRVLAIDNIRRNIMSNLSLVLLYRIQRVCSDFRLWSRAALPAAGVLAPMAARAGSESILSPTALSQKVEVAHVGTLSCGSVPFPEELQVPDGRQIFDMAVARGPGGSIYLAGGKQNVIAHDLLVDSSVTAVPDVRAWRPGPNGGRWESLPPMPSAVSDAGVCAVTMPEGDEALVVIGRTVDRETARTVQVLRRGSWSELSPFPSDRRNFSLCALSGGRIVVIGGQTQETDNFISIFRESQVVEMLDISQDSWETLPEMREGRIRPQVVEHNGTLTVIGGSKMGEGFQSSLFPSSRQMHTSCEQLQIGAEEWAEMAPLPIAPSTSHAFQLADIARGCICVMQEQRPATEAAEAAAAGSFADIFGNPRRELACHYYILGAQQEATWRTKVIGQADTMPMHAWKAINTGADKNARWLSEHGSSQKTSS